LHSKQQLQPLDLPCNFTHTTTKAIVFLARDFSFISYSRLPEFSGKKKGTAVMLEDLVFKQQK